MQVDLVAAYGRLLDVTLAAIRQPATLGNVDFIVLQDGRDWCWRDVSFERGRLRIGMQRRAGASLGFRDALLQLLSIDNFHHFD
jgi:hypothetical protein